MSLSGSPPSRVAAWTCAAMAMALTMSVGAQTATGVQPQTVTFTVPYELTHPKGVEAGVFCQIRDAGRNSLVSNLTKVTLNTPSDSLGATVLSKGSVAIALSLTVSGVQNAANWHCELLRLDGVPSRVLSEVNTLGKINFMPGGSRLSASGGYFE